MCQDARRDRDDEPRHISWVTFVNTIFAFTITRGRIVEIDLVADRDSIRELNLVVLGN